MSAPTATSLTPSIRALFAKGRAEWPGLPVEPSFFVDRVIESLPAAGDAAAALEALHPGDFYLACACVKGDATALAELDRVIQSARSALERVLGASLTLADDAEQILRRKLCTDLEGPARIGEYSGRGRLKNWVRAVATRVALDLRRTERDHEELSDNASDPLGLLSSDAELSLIKRRDRPRFEAAFARALASLPSRERNVLRLHVVDGLTVEAVARFYGVNKSTVSRWIGQARAAVVSDVRRALEKEMKLRGGELQSFIGLFQSRLDVSISHFLARAAG